MHRIKTIACISLLQLVFALSPVLASAPVKVAVSANFFAPLKSLKPQLQAQCQCELVLTPGASGVLAAQLANGAPFDLFLSADSDKPKWLFKQKIVSDAPVTYAVGKLALLDKHRAQVTPEHLGIPTANNTEWRIAMANAKTAPYGVAAEQYLAGFSEASKSRIIRGNSVMQVMQFFTTGAVDQALVSASLVAHYELPFGSVVIVPTNYYQPIIQQGVVNQRGNRQLALRVLKQLLTPDIQQTLARLGYQPIEHNLYD